MLALALAAMLLLGLGGCGKKENRAEPDVPADLLSRSVVEVADPERALEEIYQDVTVEDLYDADDETLMEKFFIDPAMLESYQVRYASGRYGVADVFILQPFEEDLPQVREQLEQVKLNRAREFENYDIYNAHQIAQEAPIFEQGGYLVILMLEDAEAARRVIDQYIPK